MADDTFEEMAAAGEIYQIPYRKLVFNEENTKNAGGPLGKTTPDTGINP